MIFACSQDAEELKNLVDVINVRVTEMFYGVPFFQNVTASTYNAAKIAGLPLQEYWSEDSNVKYVPPVGEKAWSDVARTNIVWARAYNFTDGVFHPNKAE